MNKKQPIKPGWCTWITGLPGSGKSVIANSLLKILNKNQIHAQLLSSDELRKILTPKPVYSLEERDRVYETIVYIATLLTRNGTNIIIDATGNLRRYRDEARKQIKRFIEVYLECPLQTCIDRETKRNRTYSAPKKIYSRAKNEDKANTVPGLGQPYEQPLNPEVTINTEKCSPEQCARKIFKEIQSATISSY